MKKIFKSFCKKEWGLGGEGKKLVSTRFFPRHQILKLLLWLIAFGLACVIGVVLFVCYCNYAVRSCGKFCYEEIEKVPVYETALVPGTAKVNRWGGANGWCEVTIDNEHPISYTQIREILENDLQPAEHAHKTAVPYPYTIYSAPFGKIRGVRNLFRFVYMIPCLIPGEIIKIDKISFRINDDFRQIINRKRCSCFLKKQFAHIFSVKKILFL